MTDPEIWIIYKDINGRYSVATTSLIQVKHPDGESDVDTLSPFQVIGSRTEIDHALERLATLRRSA